MPPKTLKRTVPIVVDDTEKSLDAVLAKVLDAAESGWVLTKYAIDMDAAKVRLEFE